MIFALPRKWTFPPMELEPGGFAIVFASGKTAPTAPPICTNFRLSPKGEYLALIEPDGLTVAHEYLPSIPPWTPTCPSGFAARNLEQVEPLR